jgi:D-alanine-D-alanine ligase
VTNLSELQEAISEACRLDYKFLVEEEIKGREIEFGFLDNRVSDPAEVKREGEIYTYAGKYGPNPTPTHFRVPLPAPASAAGKRAAETVFRACGCSGLARIDFFLKADGTWVLNEVNPMPGCTPTSAYPKMWAAEGVSLTELVDRVVIAALHRHRTR